jgi:rare lipoprotein A
LARALLFAAFPIAVPLGASTAQNNELAVQYGDASASGSTTTDLDDFGSHFEGVVTPLDPDTDVELALPPTAVDLGTFEPPLEVKPDILRKLGTGVASYYGRRFHGRRTANGERFDMNAMTAAHKTLPFGTHVRVTNPRNGRSVTVRINDRGPFIRGRTIDLSRAAAQKIGMIASGHARVELDVVAR